ncbi:hypothetical protein EYZ11_007798 [Aspergillus tanneri]|uniref:Uncharacterized protein n=1 Tax=Aspergillus tanneri TaxID=1220188 RepID=A0A4S3JHN6_9EURO|nr:hypothetical protein EYZ11_007798 [Aspergillus tanneri]
MLCLEFPRVEAAKPVANRRKRLGCTTPLSARLAHCKIPCLGNGQQRYKFKEQMVIRGTPIRSQGSLSPSKVPHSPSSEGTATASALVTILDITDVRYELTYYGEFLKDIPRRLGTNDVLDASVTALTYAYPSLRTSQPSPEALNKYVNALKTLRLGLQDPVKMRTMEALCGIYLIVVCQVRACILIDRLTLTATELAL